jgi:hypothetical protein
VDEQPSNHERPADANPDDIVIANPSAIGNPDEEPIVWFPPHIAALFANNPPCDCDE